MKNKFAVFIFALLVSMTAVVSPACNGAGQFSKKSGAHRFAGTIHD